MLPKNIHKGFGKSILNQKTLKIPKYAHLGTLHTCFNYPFQRKLRQMATELKKKLLLGNSILNKSDLP